MVPISKINHSLDIYQDKNIVMWGESREMFALFAHFNLPIQALCARKYKDDPIDDLPLISPAELRNKNILIQFALPEDVEAQIRRRYSELLSEVPWISTGEARTMLQFLAKVEHIQQYPQLLEESKALGEMAQRKMKVDLQEYLLNPANEPPLLLCLPSKTGDHSLIETFLAHDISHHFMHHSPDAFDKEIFGKKEGKIKVITAVRDPLAKIFSQMFDEIKQLDQSYYLWACELTTMEEPFLKEGGDAQYLFDQQSRTNYFHMPLFFKRFADHFLDLTAQPFDREKGYSVMEKGNIQVFVYQLEQLQHILPALSEFVGCPLKKLTKANEGMKQWSGEAYQRAMDQVKIDPVFYENLYDELWLEHFYTEVQILEFRNRWMKNVHG